MTTKETSDSKEKPQIEEIWGKVFTKVMAIPGVRVDRKAFLRTALAKDCTEQQIALAIEKRPALAGIPPKAIDAAAGQSVVWHRAGVSAASAALSMPGGLSFVATVPSDLVQYFYHVIVIAQKLAYLYGWPDFFDKEGKPELDEETTHLLTAFVGVMMGMETAAIGLTEFAKAASKVAVGRIPYLTVTRTLMVQISGDAARLIGTRLTENLFTRTVGRIVPLISGVVGGAMTWITFSSMTALLQSHLKKTDFAKPDRPPVPG